MNRGISHNDRTSEEIKSLSLSLTASLPYSRQRVSGSVDRKHEDKEE
jgi:hypothetical protein